MTPDWPLLGQVTALGVSGFVMAVTNSLTQIACNATLQTWGGDVYVGIMTVINSVRELFTLPVHGLTQGAQPVLSYNYGAGKYRRVRKGIVFMTVSCFAFTSLVWLVTITKPALFIHLFNSDEQLVTLGAPALTLFFQGFFMMSFQFSGQAVYVALNRPRSAVFFSLLRKAVIVVPLTLALPHFFGLGVNGVFLAEPISNYIGGAACYITMLLTVWRDLKKADAAPEAAK